MATPQIISFLEWENRWAFIMNAFNDACDGALRPPGSITSFHAQMRPIYNAKYFMIFNGEVFRLSTKPHTDFPVASAYARLQKWSEDILFPKVTQRLKMTDLTNLTEICNVYTACHQILKWAKKAFSYLDHFSYTFDTDTSNNHFYVTFTHPSNDHAVPGDMFECWLHSAIGYTLREVPCRTRSNGNGNGSSSRTVKVNPIQNSILNTFRKAGLVSTPPALRRALKSLYEDTLLIKLDALRLWFWHSSCLKAVSLLCWIEEPGTPVPWDCFRTVIELYVPDLKQCILRDNTPQEREAMSEDGTLDWYLDLRLLEILKNEGTYAGFKENERKRKMSCRM